MKKTVGIIGMFAILFMLGGCSREETNTYKIEQGGIVTEISYIHKKDEVITQSYRYELPYELIGASNKTEAKKVLDLTTKQTKDIKGLKCAMDYKKDKAVETRTLTLKDADPKELENFAGIGFTKDKKDPKVSMEQSEKVLLKQGFKKVEK